MMEKIKTLALAEIADTAAAAEIGKYCDVTVKKLADEAAVLAEIADYEAVIVPYTANMLISEAVIDSAPKLKLIASTYGGTRQNIADIYAIRKGITVIHTGASRERPMAEYTLGLVLASMLRIADYHADMTRGNEAWPRMKYPRTRILHNRKVAVVGCGRIGKAILSLFRCFTDKLAVVSSHLTAEEAAKLGAVKMELTEAFAQNEVIILAGGNNAATFHQVGAEAFAAMQKDSLFVNIARGQMVDENAMIRAAQEKEIFLALDVFETEPLPADSPLRKLERVLQTPHRANNSIEFEERWSCLAKDIAAFAEGGTPDSALTEARAMVMSES